MTYSGIGLLALGRFLGDYYNPLSYRQKPLSLRFIDAQWVSSKTYESVSWPMRPFPDVAAIAGQQPHHRRTCTILRAYSWHTRPNWHSFERGATSPCTRLNSQLRGHCGQISHHTRQTFQPCREDGLAVGHFRLSHCHATGNPPQLSRMKEAYCAQTCG